jgi:hypothetical protein
MLPSPNLDCCEPYQWKRYTCKGVEGIWTAGFVGSVSSGIVCGLMSRPTTGANAAAAEGTGAKKNKGKKLLMTGHDGLSGFTSVAFKMHEGIR